MKTLVLILALVLLPVAVHGQEEDATSGTRVAVAQISGIDADRLSLELRRDIDALVGRPLDLMEVAVLAERIERERHGVATSFRALRTETGDARVVFFAARLQREPRHDRGFDRDLESGDNVNFRYTIEKVVIEGIPESSLSQSLRDDLQKLAGTQLQHAQTQGLSRRLRNEFPGYDVDRKVSRGSEPGQVVLAFEFHEGEGMRWVRYTPVDTKFLYYETEGWSGLLDIPISGRHVRVTPLFAFSNDDDLVEEYSGGGLRVEVRGVGTERVGIGFEASRYEADWRNITLAALALNGELSDAYDRRSTVAPWATFAFSPRLRVSAGFSATELERHSRPGTIQKVNAFTLDGSYDQRWPAGDASQDVETSASLRVASSGLDGDLDYTRWQWDGRYRYHWNEHTHLIVAAMAGHLTAPAPLFERFTLGDSHTLRGWNKYDITPAGGDSMYHVTAEYRFHGLAVFSDLGSVWGLDTESRFRASSGVGLHFDNFFATYGIALNREFVNGIFMIGVRF